MGTVGECRLCGKRSTLQRSHLIPRFVARWLIRTSITGGTRLSEQPNIRLQDISKKPLLCLSCEQRFNRDETMFARNVFEPLRRGEVAEFQYGSWMARFAVSVTWRALFSKVNHRAELPPPAVSAEKAWRSFLLGESKHPASFSQHMFLARRGALMPTASFAGVGTPVNLNRYVYRSIHATPLLAADGSAALVFANMCGVILVGKIAIPEAPQLWRPSRIAIGRGTIRADLTQLPPSLLFFIHSFARDAAVVKFSDAQEKKIQQRAGKLMAKLRDSEPPHDSDSKEKGLSLLADWLTFGDRAVE